jgi:predicted porin
MKKSLFALAAVTAFAGAAQAQSSVTVYGILDVGYIGGNSRLSSSAIKSNQGQLKQTNSQFGQSAESTSRLGFKGTEDLGGGTSAFFTAEFELYPQDQSLSGNDRGGLRNRQAFVGMAKKGLGQTAVGTQYTVVFNAGTATNPNGQNNMIGDLVYAGAPIVGNRGYDNGGAISAAQTNRTSNTLTLKSEKFSGFSASAMYTLNNQNSSQSTAAGAWALNTSGVATQAASGTVGGSQNASGWGLGADYTLNKFYVTAAYQSFKVLNTNTSTVAVWANAQPSANLYSAAGTALSQASNVQDNQFLAGATYDFGILKAYAQYINRKATSTITSNNYMKRTAEQIGVRSFITPTIEAWASGSLGRYTAYGANTPTANMNAWQLGSNYYISKRTNLYAIYGQQIISTSAAGTTSGSASANNYAVGVRHTF